MGMFLDLLAGKPDILVDPTGTVEGLNNKAKLIIPRAHGFRTAANYIRNLYHCMADLPLPRTVHTFV